MIQFRELLRRLVTAELDFIVVGGLAATIHGATEPTRDLDICIRLTRESWERVVAVLTPLHPRWALTPDRRPLDVTPEQLQQFRNLYVLTDLGRIDFLGEIPPLGDFESLNAKIKWVHIEDLRVRVISLDDLIRVKEHLRRPKDLEVAAELRAIRDRLQAGPNDGDTST